MAARLTCLAFWAVAIAAPGYARAPDPAKPVATGVFSGRWYEIARTANLRERGCATVSFTFSPPVDGRFTLVQACRKQTPGATEDTLTTHAQIVPGSQNAKFKVSLFGGLVSQTYLIADHADDYGWAIMTTPAGHYVWLVARRPTLDVPTQARAVARMRALGFDMSRVTFPR